VGVLTDTTDYVTTDSAPPHIGAAFDVKNAEYF